MRRSVRSHTLTATQALSSPIPAEAFKAEVRSWAQRLEVEPAEIHLVGMTRKWASCSPRGRVTFDTGLLSQAEEFRREVIVHELLHLKLPNHGALFHALLHAHLSAERGPDGDQLLYVTPESDAHANVSNGGPSLGCAHGAGR
jgi:predicted metal-dependent hydrolase